jgi:hypothetical protein
MKSPLNAENGRRKSVKQRDSHHAPDNFPKGRQCTALATELAVNLAKRLGKQGLRG